MLSNTVLALLDAVLVVYVGVDVDVGVFSAFVIRNNTLVVGFMMSFPRTMESSFNLSHKTNEGATLVKIFGCWFNIWLHKFHFSSP